MTREHGLVALTRDIPGHGLLAGDVGTIVMVLENQEAYDVEFVTEDGQMAALLVLQQNDFQVIPTALGASRRRGATSILHVNLSDEASKPSRAAS